MITEAINRILALAPVQTLDIEGRTYTNNAIRPVVDPVQSELTVMTLTGLVDYLTADPDAVMQSKPVIHVKSPTRVTSFSPVSQPWYQRDEYVEANAEPKQFRFGQYLSVEEFIVSLQSYFVQDKTTAALLKVVGNLSDDTTVKYQDDGVTQQVQAKTGIARVGDVALPNPVALRPFRTFGEIEQPASLFVFRLRKADATGPMAALFEADGGYWQLDAVRSLRDYLRNALPETVTILA